MRSCAAVRISYRDLVSIAALEDNVDSVFFLDILEVIAVLHIDFLAINDDLDDLGVFARDEAERRVAALRPLLCSRSNRAIAFPSNLNFKGLLSRVFRSFGVWLRDTAVAHIDSAGGLLHGNPE